MIRFVTRAELRGFAANITLTEQASVLRTASARSPAGSTFLSHSSKDQDLVVGATIVLQNHGAVVYIDEIDPEMPPYAAPEASDFFQSHGLEIWRSSLPYRA